VSPWEAIIMKAKLILALLILLATFSTVSCNKQEGPIREAISRKDDYQQAYVYGFPMIAAYKAMYEFSSTSRTRSTRRRLTQSGEPPRPLLLKTPPLS
jgi:hypothetical protein